MVNYRKCLVFACFADYFNFENHILHIFYYDNCFYNSYKGPNTEKNSDVPD